ncbi:hypothetical protein AVEN_445-1, partial [Araneus ventricosus]
GGFNNEEQEKATFAYLQIPDQGLSSLLRWRFNEETREQGLSSTQDQAYLHS